MEQVQISFSNPIHVIAIASMLVGALIVLKDMYATGLHYELIFKIILAPITLYFATMGVAIAVSLILSFSIIWFLVAFPMFLFGYFPFRDTLPVLRLLP